MRRRLRAKFSRTSYSGAWIRRGKVGQRRILTNKGEVEAFLESRGFAIIDPQTMGVEEMIGKLLGAPIVVGVEGSQLSHGLLTVGDGVLSWRCSHRTASTMSTKIALTVWS